MITLLAIFFVLIAVLLVLVVLVQRGRGGGLSGAFGAGGGTTAAFGTKTGDVFTTVTVILFVVFMLMAIWLNFKFKGWNEDLPVSATAPAVVTSPSDTGTPSGMPVGTGETTTPPANPTTPPAVPTTPPASPTTAPTTAPR